MNNINLNLEVRKDIGGRKVKRLRKNGYIPATVYGRGMEPISAQIKASDFRDIILTHGRNSIFNTEFAAEQDFSVLIRNIQRDEYNSAIVNVDFQKVSLTEKVHTEVPVRVNGVERVEKLGNTVVHQLSEVTVECLPQNIPQYIDADISTMSSGYTLTAGQLKIPQGVTLLTGPNSVILSVTTGRHDLQVNKVDEPVVPQGEEGQVEAKRI